MATKKDQNPVPAEQTPVEPVTGEQTPAEQTPAEQTPAEQTPAEPDTGEQQGNRLTHVVWDECDREAAEERKAVHPDELPYWSPNGGDGAHIVQVVDPAGWFEAVVRSDGSFSIKVLANVPRHARTPGYVDWHDQVITGSSLTQFADRVNALVEVMGEGAEGWNA